MSIYQLAQDFLAFRISWEHLAMANDEHSWKITHLKMDATQ